MKIGLYGGTFDPIHVGHLLMAESALIEANLQEVSFIPAFSPPHKDSKAGNVEDRVSMLRLAIQDRPQFQIDMREIESKQVQYSIDTVREIQSQHPENEYYFIMGEDSLLSLKTWYQWQNLIKEIPLLVVLRPNTQVSTKEDREAILEEFRQYGARIQVIDQFSVKCSSSEIRAQLAKGHMPRYIFPPDVMDYIIEKHLYGYHAKREESYEYALQDFYRRLEEERLPYDEEPYLEWIPRLQEDLGEKRCRHVLGVAKTAQMLARRYGASVKKARDAALLHDCAKKNEKRFFHELLLKGILQPEDWIPSPVYHAFLGGIVAKEYYGVEDPEILRAIAHHTTGCPEMSLLEKVVMLADEIEPARSFKGVNEIRAVALKDLNQAVLMLMDQTLEFLIQKETEIDEESIQTRNQLLIEYKGLEPIPSINSLERKYFGKSASTENDKK
ncbi:MAG: nicotinate (nicotinamide) nucleotide adenylyltransferase [Peptoniphilaceae bacterium]|nr:nicotinate (nicotinamide) nucleotide adenylyltransferase [Peptoniphilaceae bacterium]MDD7433892.1 nicotinate (nicotinamide) nucleotide adenylyltransferase [Peptoniphilaceae bacterium]MDY3075201.1 nicotinate (nicotinamide) nucleotide adenylyltransferase [Peptoniphilaceae bacterium]MDY5841448.1 nicotinate (nicotinamide) nucleotide adenylyltransferase [Peptoniphilaceae bacterium]MDY6147261.1 nicotinate (nicotinamide) nucleotide adenylyltransferase [Peptoniphilaceae bacterium]